MTSEESAARLRRLRREPPPFRRVSVRSVEPLTPRMQRIVVGGDELDGFAIDGPASSVRLLLPAADDALVMPTWTGNQFELPDGQRAPIRTFTPRAFDDERLELTLDIVLHEEGAASDWARGASIDDEVAISGPGRTDDLVADARSYLLAGDETTIPAISQLLEALGDCAVTVHLEIATSDARLDLPVHPDADVTWHVAGDDSEPGDAVVAAVTALDDLPDGIWVAGEAAAVQRLRKYLFDERGRSRDDVIARGYWKQGRSAT